MEKSSTSTEEPDQVAAALNDALRMVKYAAEVGIEIDPGVRENILQANSKGIDPLDVKMKAAIFAGLTQLAQRLKPVTGETLKATYDEDTKDTILKKYRRFASYLLGFIVFFSLVSFITTALSNTVSAKIATANGLAAQLRTALGPTYDETNAPPEIKDPSRAPPGADQLDVITKLQQYASSIRDINSRSRQLNWFIGNVATEYYLEKLKKGNGTGDQSFKEFQLEVGLPNLWSAEANQTKLYQHVRAFAQSVIDDTTVIYGAFGSCILPVLYSLFGACAYLLRNYEQQVKAHTFVPSSGDSARFVIASICGAVVGLFNFSVTQGAAASPLAIAFLVGFGVDVFYTFLEGLLQMFTKGNPK